MRFSRYAALMLPKKIEYAITEPRKSHTLFLHIFYLLRNVFMKGFDSRFKLIQLFIESVSIGVHLLKSLLLFLLNCFLMGLQLVCGGLFLVCHFFTSWFLSRFSAAHHHSLHQKLQELFKLNLRGLNDDS